MKIRLVARLDIKGENLIKGIHLEGLRSLGDPNTYASKYTEDGIDELLFVDSVASLYQRNNIFSVIKKAANNIFIPITVAGGIRSIADVESALISGADKVAINTAAIKNPSLIEEIARAFGSQCMVVSIEAKKISTNKWEAYTHNGREPSGLNVIEWASRCANFGAGEILITSIDQEGTRKGFDVELIRSVNNIVNIPIIASGGMGKPSHIVEAINEGGADAIAIADSLHYNRHTIPEIKNYLLNNNINVRKNNL